MRDDSIERFKEAAKPYGLDFIHIHDGNGDGMSTVMVRGEDAAIINRLIRRNNLDVLTDVTQDEIALDPARAAEVNEPIPEVIVDKDGVRVQDAVRDSRSSAQDMVKGAEAGNPANGQTAERQGRPSGIALQHTERMPAEADALWADVNASIEKDFADRVEAQRQRRLELYNQDDPLLNQNSAPKKVQTRTSVKKELAEKKKIVQSMKKDRVKAALEKQTPAKMPVQRMRQK